MTETDGGPKGIQSSEDGVVVVLGNPTAGGGAADRVARQSIHTLGGYGAPAVLVVPSTAERTPEEVARAIEGAVAAGYPPRALAAVGGDGTVRLAAGLAASHGLPLGIIPAGTGNGIAYSLGLPVDPWEACRVVARGRPRPCDLGLIEGLSGGANKPLHFVNVCGAGLDAAITQTYHEQGLGVRGVPGYVIAAARSLATYHAFPVEILVDDRRLQLEVLLVAVGNGAFYGKGIPIAPSADPSDGLLDVCLVLPMGIGELSALVPMFLLGRHERHPRVRTFRAHEIVVGLGPQAERPVAVHADGDVVGRLPVRVSLVSKGIRFLLDEETRVGRPSGRAT